MNTSLTGQFIPGDSLIHRLDARAKFFGFLFFTAAIILTSSVIGYALTLAAVAAVIALSRFPLVTVLGAIRRMFVFFIAIFLLNALFFSAENPYWQWWIFSLSREGIIQGGNVVSRVILIMALSNVLTLSTPPMELVSAIEALLKPLSYVCLPTEDIAIILSVAIQFIPTLMEETATIKKAQTARGAPFESKRLRERLMSVPPLVVPIFLSAFKRADELSMAMEARGYRGAKFRTKRDKAPFSLAGWLSILVCAALCAAQIFI